MAEILSKGLTGKGFVLPDGYSWDAKLIDGKKEGEITVEDEYGCIACVLHFHDDKLNGICDFYDLGSLVEKRTFVDNVEEGWACVIELGEEVRWYLYFNGDKNAELKKCTNMKDYWQAVNISSNQLISICKYDNNHMPIDKGYIFDNGHIGRIVLFENGKEKSVMKSFGKNEMMIEYDNSDNIVYKGGFADDISKDYPREGKGMEFVGGVLIYAGEWKNGNRDGKGKTLKNRFAEYEGGWKEGLPNGLGLLNRDGKSYKGDWDMGRLKLNEYETYDYVTGKIIRPQPKPIKTVKTGQIIHNEMKKPEPMSQQSQPSTETTIAIDFGTTNSVVYLKKGKTMNCVIAGDYGVWPGGVMFASYVEYTKAGVVVGRTAKRNFGKKNKFVIAAVKRIIGLTYEEYEKMKDKTIFGCEVVRGDDGYPYFVVDKDGRQVSPIEVASELFKVMKHQAGFYPSINYTQAYVTVPANFKDHQCEAIKKAAELAGLKVLKLITEPTAACMSWCFDNSDKLNVGENMIVYDFGRSTFNVSLVQYRGGKQFLVRAVDGNPNLGGDDIDNAILDYMVKKCEEVTGVDVSKKVQLRRYRSALRSSCEDAKIIITNSSESMYDDDETTFLKNTRNVYLPVPFSDLGEDDVDDVDCTVEDLNNAIREKVQETVDITIRMMEKEKLMVGNIRYVMLVGESSHLHLIKQLIRKKFIRARFPIRDSNKAVAEGAMRFLMSDSDPDSSLCY